MTILSENLVLQKTKLESLSNVKNLSLWGSDLTDITILRRMKNVEVLSLSVNRIASLQSFSECKQLRELYLRKNEIADLAQVGYLLQLPLRILWLCDNPCSLHPLYRLFTIRCCSQLTKLDNVDVAPQERSQAERLTTKEIQSIISSSEDSNCSAFLQECFLNVGVKKTSAAPTSAGAAAAAVVPSPTDNGLPMMKNAPSSAGTGKPHSIDSDTPHSAAAHTPTSTTASSNTTSSSSNSNNTQKALVSAALTLIGEMSKESQTILYRELSQRLRG